MIVRAVASILRDAWSSLTIVYFMGILIFGGFFLLLLFTVDTSIPLEAAGLGSVLAIFYALLAMATGNYLGVLFESPITRLIPNYINIHLIVFLSLLAGVPVASWLLAPDLFSMPFSIPLSMVATLFGLTLGFAGSYITRLVILYSLLLVVVIWGDVLEIGFTALMDNPMVTVLLYAVAIFLTLGFCFQVRRLRRICVPRRSMVTDMGGGLGQQPALNPTGALATLLNPIGALFTLIADPDDVDYASDDVRYGLIGLRGWRLPLLHAGCLTAIFTILLWMQEDSTMIQLMIPLIPAVAVVSLAAGGLRRGSEELGRLWFMGRFARREDLIAHMLAVLARQTLKCTCLLGVVSVPVLALMLPGAVIPTLIQLAVSPVTGLLLVCLTSSSARSPARVSIQTMIEFRQLFLPLCIAGLHIWLAYLVIHEYWDWVAGVVLSCLMLLFLLYSHTVKHIAGLPWSDRV